MRNVGKFLINGEWVAAISRSTDALVSPADETIGGIPILVAGDGNRAGLEDRLDRLQAAQPERQ